MTPLDGNAKIYIRHHFFTFLIFALIFFVSQRERHRERTSHLGIYEVLQFCLINYILTSHLGIYEVLQFCLINYILSFLLIKRFLAAKSTMFLRPISMATVINGSALAATSRCRQTFQFDISYYRH